MACAVDETPIFWQVVDEFARGRHHWRAGSDDVDPTTVELPAQRERGEPCP